MSETKEDQIRADSAEGELLDMDDIANDIGTGSENSLSDGESEEDKPSRSVEDFPTSSRTQRLFVVHHARSSEHSFGAHNEWHEYEGRLHREHNVLPIIQSP